jgi:hypothetical protein
MYDEKELAENVINNGFENGSYNWQEALWVAKYFRHIYGYGDSKIGSQMLEFCTNNDPFFYPIPRRRTIKNLVRESRYVLYDYTDPLDIREAELEKINNIKNFKFQQIALGILTIAKRNYKYNAGYLNWYFWKDVKWVVNFKRINNLEIEKCFEVLNSLDMVYPTYTTNSHKILFLDSDSPVIFHVEVDREMRNLGLEYKKYRGGEIAYCSNCGNEIIKKSNRHHLCDNCWKIKHNLLEKERYYKKKQNFGV